MKVVVVGGGLTGLTAAYKLSTEGHIVEVFEGENILGGLSSSIEVGGSRVERYYHHIFKNDRRVLDVIRELGLEGGLIWRNTGMGFHTESGNHAFGTPLELLKFPGLSLMDKMRFGRIVLEMRLRLEWRDLDGISAMEWLKDKGGSRLYERVWEPLLRMKFGGLYDRASAAWLWGRLNPRAKSRSGFMGKEVLGYLDGSFQVLIDRLAEEVTENGGRVRTGSGVEWINVDEKTVEVKNLGVRDADAILYTGPASRLVEMAELPADYRLRLESIRYQVVVCLMLELDERLGGFYWLNNGDSDLMAGGVVEHTNFIPPERYGRHIVYVFTYLEPGDRLLNDRGKLGWMLLEELGRIYPSLKKKRVLASRLHVDEYATPVYDIGFKDRRPGIRTPVPGLYVSGMTEVYPCDRNIDGAVRVGLEAAEVLMGDFKERR